MFTETEINLLNSAYQTFIGRTHVFDVLSEAKWSNAGIENWVQIEFAVALVDRDYEVTTVGKRERDCDLLVNDIGIEIRALTRASFSSLKSAFKDHKKAELYFYICKFDEKKWNEFRKYLKEQGYIEIARTFNDWIVVLVKKA